MPKVTKRQITGDGRKLYSTYEKPWRRLNFKEFSIASSKRLAVAGLCGAIVIASLPDGPIDFWGDKGRLTTEEEVRSMVLAQRREIFARELVPVARYYLSYIGSTSEDDNDGISYNGIVGNNGILGILNSLSKFGSHDAREINAGDDCLAGTSYDTTPSEIRGRSTGDVSAVASIYAEIINGVETITILPAATDAKNLVFTVKSDGFLGAADDDTQNILAAYGCKQDLNS